MKKKLLSVFVLMLAVLMCACNTDDNPVPERQVDFYVNINNAEFSKLQNPGGWAYVGGGYNGIFIYNFDNTTYYAYDRACTCNYNHAPLVYDERHHLLHHADTLANCNSRYNVVLQGAVQSGDAKFPLRRYDVLVYDGRLRVVNYL
ncbi:MAG: hypothetical protein MJZ66_01845 [Bacteroidales bacterium]|nr:hypothetical protein [Bacteroidales bacterium]